MAEPLAFLNGAFLPQSRAHLSISDGGLVWGATATDLCRTFRHQLFRLDDHLERFINSCKICRIPLEESRRRLRTIAQELVEKNARSLAAAEDLVLVLFATPGEVGYYFGRETNRPPTLCLHTFPLPCWRYAPLVRDGAQLVIPAMNLGHPAEVVQAKHRSRLHWRLVEHEVRAKNPDALPLFAYGGLITETPTANFLVVRDGVVFSPQPDTILPGISLKVVQELCRDLGIDFRHVELRVQDWAFGHCQEAMLCSTPYGIAPVASIDGRQIPIKGPVFSALLRAWNERVGMDIHEQILRQASRRRAKTRRVMAERRRRAYP